MLSSLLAQSTKSLYGSGSHWLPPRASSIAGDVDWILSFVMWITVFFTVLIFGLMIYFIFKYRHKPGSKPVPSAGHSTALELTWTIIPTILVVVIFFLGFREYLRMIVVPPNTYEIRAHGYMWGWTFFYPNGAILPELHVPEGREVRVVLTSEDVIHALYIPAFRLQKSNVPGRYNKIWFKAQFVNPEKAEQPTADGQPYTEEHMIYCNQYCGTKHAEMLSKVIVHRAADFAAKLDELGDWKNSGRTFAEQGKLFYTQRGCVQCHSIDGTKGTGPTWKDAWGHEGKFVTGETYKQTDDYIRESILYPDRHIVAGYTNAMPSYRGQLKDHDIDAIIAYMKTLSKYWDGGDPNPPTTKPAATPAGAPSAAPATP